MLHRFSDLPAFRRDPLAFLETRGRGEAVLPPIHLGIKPIFLVNDPGLVRDVLRADEAMIDKGRHIAQLQKIVGLNSLTMSGPAQRERRAAIHRVFAKGMATDYVPQFAAVVRSWIASLAKHDAIEAHRTTAHLTLRVICAILFGQGALSPGDENTLIEAVRLIEDDLADDMFRALPRLPWTTLRRRRRLEQARAMMGFVVDRTCGRATSLSLIRGLESLGLDRDAIRNEVLLILLAGHHTTGAAAAWGLYHLSTDRALAEELAREAAALTDDKGEITPIALRSASVSRAFAHEMLRLYPSTYWMSRDLMRDQTISGRRLARGTTLLISQWHLHRDPRYWEAPDQLRLDREWTSNPAYLPFGLGSRACTGMSIASLMLQLISLEFALSFTSSVVSPVPAGSPKASVTLVPPQIRIKLDLRPTSSGHIRDVAA